MNNLAFVTGARSEYGIMKNVIKACGNIQSLNVSIIATGMHFQHKYGDTIKEIEIDALAPIIYAPCYVEEEREKEKDFIALINILYTTYQNNYIDYIYIIGDRLEAYAAALAAHFLKIKIAHFAGGQITNGAVDNIYRYNISNLADIHLVTNRYAVDRLKSVPIINCNNIFLVGSSAIDSIKRYLDNPREASEIDPRLIKGNYVLMTFHSETLSKTNINSIPEIMDKCISKIIEKGYKVLVTYPNNDDGSETIVKIIKKWSNNDCVIAIKSLGANQYYVAVDNSAFVIGNSSSGIIEIPYFQKYTFNIGERQSGRNAPRSVINSPNNWNIVEKKLEELLENPLCNYAQEYIYGNGNSLDKIVKCIKNKFCQNEDTSHYTC